jgi:predicted AlkP superfamily pyrophosphatase or phosphodiesterase
VTAAGHASLLTGTSPYRHGIVANEWYDRKLGERVTSVESRKYRPVPAPADTKRVIYGAGPDRRRAPAVGDMLLDAHKGKAKVVSLSIKDRSSILLAALRAICLWFSTSAGSFVSSTNYCDDLPSWAAEFNKEKVADQWFGKDWTRLHADLDYVKYSSAANPFQGVGYKQGETFPHPTTGGADKITRDYYQAMTTSPFGNELLLALAKRAIVAEKLGQGEVPDMLCLSFSSNDLVGHCWGPDSQEVLDMTLRTDRIIKELLDFLDDKVGKDSYILAISADHGVCPIPEISKARGKEAGRISPKLFTTDASAFLDETFGKKDEKLPWIESAGGEGIFLNHGNLKNLNLEQSRVEDALAKWFVKQTGIQAAYTRTQLLKGIPEDDVVGTMVRRSFHPECNGDVITVLKPYYQVSGAITSNKQDAYRTSHGSPHEYDTHVPLFVYGPGVKPGTRDERVPPQIAAAILAEALGVRAPTQAEYTVPKGLWK